MPLGVEGVGQAGSAASSSSGVFGISQSSSTSETSSQRTKQTQSQLQSPARPRTISKTSRRSNKSARREELRLILDFPLPPTFIPTPPKTRTPPPPSRPVAPVNDDASVFYDHDPFRSEPVRDQDAAAEVASLNIGEEGAPRADSSASFYTAHSRTSSPARPPQSPHPSQQQRHPSVQLPLPEPSFSPQLSHSATLSTSHRSVRTLNKASATLKRLGNRTRDTLLTSIRAPISELSVRRQRRTRVKHVSLDQLPLSSHHLPRPVLPDFEPEAFDIAFPAVETPRISPRVSRALRSNPSVQSFYASLEDFLTSHLHSEQSNRRSRFKSAPTLLLTTDRDLPRRPDSLSAELQVSPLTPPLPLPRTERPLPPLPREGYDFVDPITLTESTTVSSSSERRYSSIPPSPSWLSRNVRELEIALSKKSESSSAASSRSACGSDTEHISTVHIPKAVQTRTSSPSTTSSSTRLHGEVVLLRGRVNIQDTTPQRITLRSRTPSSKTPSESTVVLRTRSRSRRNRSVYPTQSRLVISTFPPNPPVRPRSRTSSVTKATITHYRRSLLETKKKSRSRKEDTGKFAAGAKAPKVRLELPIRPHHLTITFLLIKDTFIFQFISVSRDEPAHCFSSSAFGDCPRL